MKKTKGQKKVAKVMKEFKSGTLHSGKKGPVVKSKKQAVAIAMSEAGMKMKKKKGK
jgi:ribosomal protein L21E